VVYEMDFLHYELQLGAHDIVEVTLDRQANVRLLDDINFAKYRRGDGHTDLGGLAKVSPARLSVPHAGHWHLVIDLGGYPGTVRASVSTIRR
jgi:hypothetical protein